MSSFLYRSSANRKLFNKPAPRVKEVESDVAPVLSSLEETLKETPTTTKVVAVVLIIVVIVAALLALLL